MSRRGVAVGLALAGAAAAPVGRARADEVPPAGAAPESAEADRDDDEIVPDRRARAQAAEANLEPERQREGLAIGVLLGPSMQVGFGIEEASAVGGSFDLRLGTSATDRLAWFVDFLLTGTARQDDTSSNTINQNATLTLGAQLYLLHALHLRAGAGLSSLTLRSESDAAQRSRGGLGVLGGGGLDLLRQGRFALSGDVTFTFSVYDGGAVGAFVAQLGATWY